MLPKRNILVIDLKSFFASCECVQRGLDPFKVDLVVANPYQGNGAITLAVTPHMKNYGIKGRIRLYEIPKNIKYIIAPPRMKLYLKKSEEVINIFLDFVSQEDLHIYSIDEAFLDLTSYLKMYKKTDIEMAKIILDKIYEKTKLTATCGIGPNMFLAKVAMDIEAKKNKTNIASWSYDDVKEKLWPITPLSKMWGIGHNMEKRLNDLGIYSVKDLALYNKNKLIEKFGIVGEELHNHANGIDLAVISNYNYVPKSSSYSSSQVLFKDYNASNIKLIIKEMSATLSSRLRKTKKQASTIGLGIGFSKTYGGGFYHNIKINPTDLESKIYEVACLIFDKFYNNEPIRKVTISAGTLIKNNSIQLDLFNNFENYEQEEKISSAIDEIKNRFGKNYIVKASALLKDSTEIERNRKIGGHHE